jgi:hypothetical protein
MPQSTPYLDTFRSQFGARRKITREQLRQFLILLSSKAGLDIRGYAGWYGASEDDAPENIARCIANTPHSLSLLSLGGQVRDIQYDQPGSMNPSQHAELSFVSEGLARGEHDADPDNDPGSTMEYLRRHAARVIVVTGDQIQPPPKPVPTPHKSPYYCPRCREDVLAEDGDFTKCPNCGTAIGQWFL